MVSSVVHTSIGKKFGNNRLNICVRNYVGPILPISTGMMSPETLEHDCATGDNNPLGNLNSGRKPGERGSLEAALRSNHTFM